jgi:hypothetical protein
VSQCGGQGDEMVMGQSDESTYIRMSADLLDDGVIEVAGVTQEITSDIVCMLEALEDVGCDGELRSLPKLGSLILAVEVDVLHPAVVIRGSSLADVLLEHYDVGIRNFNGI